MYHHYNITGFCICLYIYLYQGDLYFHILLCSSLGSFILTWRTSFSNPCNACLVVMNSLSLYLGSSLFFLHFWRSVLPQIVFLVGRFFLSVLQQYHPTPFWLVMFLLRNPLIIYERTLICNKSLLFWCFQDSLSLIVCLMHLSFWVKLLMGTLKNEIPGRTNPRARPYFLN